jgi:FixJ family two-component response regulator
MAGSPPLIVMPKPRLIAIVDDDQPFRDSMQKLLTSLAYTAEVFSSAANFLASPLLAETACLLADVNMPGMSGPELFRYLGAAGLSIPTILVTAHPDDLVRDRALNDGVTCYIYKPVDDHHLQECIRVALGDEKQLSKNS